MLANCLFFVCHLKRYNVYVLVISKLCCQPLCVRLLEFSFVGETAIEQKALTVTEYQ